MELCIKDNLSDITYMSELTPAVLIRFCECKTNQRGSIRANNLLRTSCSVSYALIEYDLRPVSTRGN